MQNQDTVKSSADPSFAVHRQEEPESWKSGALKAGDELSKLCAAIGKSKPKLPEPTPINIDPKKNALLVFDLSNRCNDLSQAAGRFAIPFNGVRRG